MTTEVQQIAEHLPSDGPDDFLVHHAMALLEGNWMGHATRPSPRLYPHQWSWDAAFIAIGYAHYDQVRAQSELISLFRGQWSNGLLPHIVFTDRDADYFPGPSFWQTERSAYAPRRPRTSGIVQPPVHATAALHIYEHASDRGEARAFLEELLPRLAAWHAYLHNDQTRPESDLVEIWHPWASGMDNSPLWDAALRRMGVTPGTHSHRRADLRAAKAAERPSDRDYDDYLHLVELFREQSYDPAHIRMVTPFAIRDVLYNSLLVEADRDLADIARIVGADPAPFDTFASLTANAIDSELWDEEHSCYHDFDVVAGEPIRTRVGAAFSPLYAGVPSPERAARMVEALQSLGVRLDEAAWAVPSVSPSDPTFLADNYWRGPIWLNVNWVLHRGLRRYGLHDLADRLRRAMIELPRRYGFHEHYDPLTGKGHGQEQFSWTAALVLNLLFEPR